MITSFTDFIALVFLFMFVFRKQWTYVFKLYVFHKMNERYGNTQKTKLKRQAPKPRRPYIV